MSKKRLPNTSVLCGSPEHPIVDYVRTWIGELRAKQVHVGLYFCEHALPRQKNSLLFIISYGKTVGRDILNRFDKCLVLHASNLPDGKGWSPHVWQIIEGAKELTVTLFEAVEQVDAGPIVAKTKIKMDGTELYDEINAQLARVELQLMDYVLERWPDLPAEPQEKRKNVTTYRKRTPDDSEVDPYRSIAEQFDLIRVCDPYRYPAFFRFRGTKYRVRLEKIVNDEYSSD